jgi:hypothetical protein
MVAHGSDGPAVRRLMETLMLIECHDRHSGDLPQGFDRCTTTIKHLVRARTRSRRGASSQSRAHRATPSAIYAPLRGILAVWGVVGYAHAVSRASRIAKTFIADEPFAREVEDVAVAVDAAQAVVEHLPVGRLLTALPDGEDVAVSDLPSRASMPEAEVAGGLARLQDLGLIQVTSAEGGPHVALTPEGTMAADRQRDVG